MTGETSGTDGTERRCNSCKWWDRDKQWDSGQPMPLGMCRARAPTGFQWPETDEQDWCGKWKRKRSATEVSMRRWLREQQSAEAKPTIDPIAVGLAAELLKKAIDDLKAVLAGMIEDTVRKARDRGAL